jgi:uncharacterized protein with HEPN domain
VRGARLHLDRIAHGYAQVDRMIIAATVREDLPELRLALDQMEQLLAERE